MSQLAAESVVVLSGGRSSEHEVSIRSGAAVAAGLRQAGFEVTAVEISREGIWSQKMPDGMTGEPVELRPGGGLLGADVVFPALHGPYGEDGTVQGLLECLDLPYVGSGVLASALCMDKLSLKRLFSFHGVAQVDFVAVGEENWRERLAEMGLPVWVKPSRLGSSVGISRVDALEDLSGAIALAARHDPRVIVEASATGLEIECSVLGDAEGSLENPATKLAVGAVEVSPPGQIVIDADWYDFEAKYSAGGMRLQVPADLTPALAEEVRALAARVFALAGCSGLARCDFFVEPDGRVLVNELNTMPGFTETSVYAKLLEAGGIAYPDLCRRLVALAQARYERESRHRF